MKPPPRFPIDIMKLGSFILKLQTNDIFFDRNHFGFGPDHVTEDTGVIRPRMEVLHLFSAILGVVKLPLHEPYIHKAYIR